jgi:hypothetical protein
MTDSPKSKTERIHEITQMSENQRNTPPNKYRVSHKILAWAYGKEIRE